MSRRTIFLLWIVVLVGCPAAGWIIGQRSGGKPHAPGDGSKPGSTGRDARAASADISPAGLSHWTTFDRAMAESRENGKPVMLDFNAEWCPPCRMMKQDVFEAGSRGDAVLTDVIPVSIVDRSREDGRNSSETDALQRQYQIEAFPTLVVFSPRTGRTTSSRGYRGADGTVQWIRNAAQQVR